MAKKAKVELKSAVALSAISEGGGFSFVSPEGLEVKSMDMAVFNSALEALGYKPIAMTYNMLNQGRSFLIDADTPWCCNPRSETYHSM
jgi:hypothetical protein